MEAAELLATQLVLPELVAIVSSYLDGCEPHTQSADAEREFAMALFPHTGNVRMVVYCTRPIQMHGPRRSLLSIPSDGKERRVEHLCLVNGLLHSFGNEPARVVVSIGSDVVQYVLEWRTFGRTCVNYIRKFTSSASSLLAYSEQFAYDETGQGYALNAINGQTDYRALYTEGKYQTCYSASHGFACAVCLDPKSKFLNHFATFDTKTIADRCMNDMDFKWIAQFCPPRNQVVNWFT